MAIDPRSTARKTKVAEAARLFLPKDTIATTVVFGTNSIVASIPSVNFRNPHPISAFGPDTPSPHPVLARVVKESCRTSNYDPAALHVYRRHFMTTEQEPEVHSQVALHEFRRARKASHWQRHDDGTPA